MIYILIESILNLSHCLQNGMLSIGVWKQKLYNEKVYTNEQRKRTNDWQKKNEHCTYTETKKKCDARHHILWAVRSTGAKLTRCAKNISFALMRPITFTIHHIHIISTVFFSFFLIFDWYFPHGRLLYGFRYYAVQLPIFDFSHSKHSLCIFLTRSSFHILVSFETFRCDGWMDGWNCLRLQIPRIFLFGFCYISHFFLIFIN